jgi:ABC-2 type transport system ATP-binding protein
VLTLLDLHKRYGDVAALDGCTFQVPRGALLGFLGPNGAGKTTAMRSILGLVRPDAGTVHWDGAAITPSVRLRFGYMPEQRGLYPRMRILDQLVYFGRLHGMAKADAEHRALAWLERLGVAERRDGRLEELSHGNQQRIQLAAALLHDPDLLVLDEPFAGLDPLGVQAMSAILAERAAAGAAVVFSSHQLDLVEDLCEDVVVINEGRIVLDGPVRELRARSPHRYLTIEVAGSAVEWAATIPGAEVVSSGDGRALLRLDDRADLGPIVALAQEAGTVRQFSFEPPNLSEVFREAVQR